MVRAAALILLAQTVLPPAPQGFDVVEANPNDWVYVTGSATGDRYYVRYRDTAQNQRQGNYEFRVWIRGDHQRNAALRERLSMTLYLINCQQMQYARLQRITYDANERQLSTESVRTSMQYPAPETVSEAFMNAICPRT